MSLSHRFGFPARCLLVVMLLLTALATGATSAATAHPAPHALAQSDRGLIDATSYQSPQFGYTLTWAGPWTTQERDVITNPGGFDTITLRGDGATVRVSGRADTYEPLVFLQDTIAIQLASGGELIDQDTTGTVPTAELLIGNERMRIDVVPLPDAGAIVLLTLRASQTGYDAALATAGQNIQLESSPLFGADGLTTGGTETATAPAATAATEEPPVLPTVAETATEEPTLLPTATPPVAATEDATPGSTQTVMGGGVEGNGYTSPNFGFTVTWDDTLWDLRPDSEFSEPDYDAFSLVNDTGLLTVTGWTAYNGSASTCLLGEVTYYNDPEAGITDWQVAVDADGNELSGETETSAWGVYTNTYVDPDDPNAAPIDYVDYIECQSLGDDAVAIFYAFSEREAYNDHIGQVLAVVDTLELAGGAELPAVEPTEAATPASIESGTPVVIPVGTPVGGTPISGPPGGESAASSLPGGETITGQAHGYRFTVPADWQVNESRLGAEPESTTLGNGTSTVTVGARSLSVPTLAACVATIADEHEAEGTYGDLRLAATASGDPFAGEDDFTAFANFTYTGPDGELWAHFIECRWIVEGQSVLVVTQDVPQELFGSERGPRRQIQNTIEVGP